MSWVDEYGIKRTNGRDETEGSNNAAPVTTFGAMRQVVIDINYDENGLPTLEHAAKVPATHYVLLGYACFTVSFAQDCNQVTFLTSA